MQSASRVYFGKDVKDLTLAECASLIGITNNPSRYDPYISAENNKERQEIILSEMLKQGYINQAQYDEAVAQELVFTNASREKKKSDDNYSWFVDQVINDVVNDLCDKTGYEYDIVYTMVKTGGYQIYSTVNPDVQAAVDQVYEDLSSLPATASSQQLQSGIVIVDNTTGDIVALAGGVGKKQGSLVWNCATRSLLSPGSIIKPFAVYAPAIELGLITPATVMDDTPYSFTDTATWPKNLDSTYRGLVSVEEAVEQSINTVPVKLVAQMTPEEVDRLMRFDGIVRNRLKITAAINNAKLFRAIQKEFGSFYEYVLSFFPGRQPIVNDFKSLSQIPATSPESDAMSRDMKKRGFKFFGSTICYAFLQATGFVNDHLTGCRCKGGRQQTAP